MSALERCWQSEVNSSYCEMSVVIGGGGAFSSACLRDCSLVCRLVAMKSCFSAGEQGEVEDSESDISASGSEAGRRVK